MLWPTAVKPTWRKHRGSATPAASYTAQGAGKRFTGPRNCSEFMDWTLAAVSRIMPDPKTRRLVHPDDIERVSECC